jgi:phytoene synthase
MASLAAFDRYAIETSAALLGLAARVLSDGRDPGGRAVILHTGVAYALAGLLRALPAHTARGQLYLPADVLQRYRVEPADIFAARPNTAIRSALAELRLHARGHLAAARHHLASAPEAILPALLPVAVVRPVLDRMERRRYQPFASGDVSQWRRQWALWRAARSGLRSAF